MTDPLLKFRPEFPILERSTYLVSNSLGAMPRTVADRLAEYADNWAELGVKAWSKGWWEMPITVGNEIAPLLGAAEGEVVMLPNVTMAQASVLSALEYRAPRNRIVMTALDFPSVSYVYHSLATRLGAEIVVVPGTSDGIGVDTERLLDAIDERTRLVAISHVLFRSAYIVDVAAVCEKAHRVGALVAHVRLPARERRREAVSDVGRDVEKAPARSAAQPFEDAAREEITADGAHVDRDDAHGVK